MHVQVSDAQMAVGGISDWKLYLVQVRGIATGWRVGFRGFCSMVLGQVLRATTGSIPYEPSSTSCRCVAL